MKRYPFNMSKHQHDIFFRLNRAKNELDDKRNDLSYRFKDGEIEKYEGLIKGLEDLMGYGPGIVYLTGKEWALATESANWAACIRGAR